MVGVSNRVSTFLLLAQTNFNSSFGFSNWIEGRFKVGFNLLLSVQIDSNSSSGLSKAVGGGGRFKVGFNLLLSAQKDFNCSLSLSKAVGGESKKSNLRGVSQGCWGARVCTFYPHSLVLEGGTLGPNGKIYGILFCQIYSRFSHQWHGHSKGNLR